MRVSATTIGRTHVNGSELTTVPGGPCVTARDDLWGPLDAAELPMVEWIEDNRGNGEVQAAAKAFTYIGEHGLVWHAIAIVGQVVDKPRRAQWRAVNVALVAAYAANNLCKLALGRRRPPTAGVGTPTELSFPSTHAATSVAAATALRGLLPRWIVLPLAIALPSSRLYFGVHYITDVLAGAVLGRFVARATLRRWPRRSR